MENTILSSIPTPDQIKHALFQMEDQKASGSDGFPAIFYKKFWDIVGENVINAVISFFQLGTMPKEINSSLIALTPKTQNPTTINNFRPISLCNSVYKIISKLLEAKIRPLLHKLISPNQASFTPRRWIVENQVVVQEMLHNFKTRKIKSGLMALKLYLQKAYDKMNWGFLKVVLMKFGFDETFVKWTMSCVSTFSFEVIVNERKSNQFRTSRGLRQGDPLSSYLFILGQEVLSRLLDREFDFKRISKVKASINGPAITHIMYTNNLILFSKSIRREATTIMECIDKYCNWLGQNLNSSESGVHLSKHTQKQSSIAIKQILQMKSSKKDAIYLGALMFLSRSPSRDFKFL